MSERPDIGPGQHPGALAAGSGSSVPGASPRPVIFPGTRQERDALLAAVRGNCACRLAQRVAPTGVCGAHALLLDRGALRHLVFYHRWRRALSRSEWLETPRWREAGV